MSPKKKRSPAKPSVPVLTEQEQLLGWVYLAVEFLVLPSAIAVFGENFGGFSAGVANLIYYLTNAVCCALIFRNLLRQSLVRAGEATGGVLLSAVLGFLLLLGAGDVVGGLAELLIPGFANANDEAVSAMVREHPLLMPVALVLLVPIGEECLFRGLLFAGILPRNRACAYTLSVLTFALIHVTGYIGAVDPLTLALCFVQYIPPGLILAAAFEHSGSLFVPILIHAAVNAGSIIALR